MPIFINLKCRKKIKLKNSLYQKKFLILNYFIVKIMNVTKIAIKGYWELIKFEAVAEDGTVILPFGPNVRGLLHYGDNELMSAQLGNAMRANFESEDFRKGKTNEIIEAYSGYISYFGKYSVNEYRKYIIHEIELSLYPNWINTRVKRLYELENNILILKAPQLDYDGIKRIPTLTWKKIENLNENYRWHS